MLTFSLLLSLSSPQLQLAPPADSAKVQFVDMEGSVVNGEIKRPQASWSNGRKQAEFGRLLSLKKSFMPVLVSSGAELMR